MAAKYDSEEMKISDNTPGVTDVPEEFLCSNESGRYKIKWGDFKRPGPTGVIKFFFQGTRATIPNKEALDLSLPIIKPDFEKLKSEETKNGMWVVWLGHASVLVQMDGKTILTDPVFGLKCGPKLKWQLGITRYRKAPCSVEDLPNIDSVVISHNHYDHLDYDTVCDLVKRFPDLNWFVPMGVKSWMEKHCGCKKVTELEWWKQKSIHDDQLTFTFVPAQHWSKRGPMDDDTTLWGGWCVRSPTHNFYFAGDTGYHERLFQQIGKSLGPFDLAAIPIGAYNPRWFMQCQHIDPNEALKIHNDVEARQSIGIHWGTFNLSSEPYLEPRDEIKRLQDTNDPKFFTVNLGESKLIRNEIKIESEQK